MTATTPVLEVEALSTSFATPRGAVHAVDDVSFTLQAGSTLGIVGESGSGKSVLCRTAMGLLPPNAHTSGSVRLNGNELLHTSVDELRRHWGLEIAMVFQDPMTSLNPVMRIGPQITESLRTRAGLSRRDARARAIDLLESVGIPAPEERVRKYAHQLSGGMRQRVVIASALSCDPQLLIADEPTTALDVTVQAQILDLLADQQSTRQMSMILVTHDLGVVANRTDHLLVMYAGRVVEAGPTATVLEAPTMPYTRALLDALPNPSTPRHQQLATIPGRPPNLIDPPKGCAFAQRCAHARPRCHTDTPPLTDGGGQRRWACWFPIGNGGT